ncbi:hypothetical protein LBMAG53_02960 [Planctomycetota bacterium]|nr:hypothetical protein LBMAG53_02960 [Planctomycetota bacterium]
MASSDFLYRLIRWSWLIHGALLLALAGTLTQAVQQTQTEEWAEAMLQAGLANLIQPVRTVAEALDEYLLAIAVTGVICTLGAVLSWSGRRRWPLQAVASAHLALLPLATWWGHGVTVAIGMGSFGQTVSELVVLALGLVAVAASLVVVHRHRPPLQSPSGQTDLGSQA